MRYPNEDQILWQFNTRNFRVVFHAEPEDQFSDQDNIAFALEGGAHWFCAFVSVWFADPDYNLNYLAHDVLGACSYRSFDEFISSHRDSNADNRNTLAVKARNRVICHYFPSMVSSAVSEARKAWHKRDGIKLRAA